MGFRRGKIDHGEMAEWSIAAVLKTVELRGSGGSNPSLSAEKQRVQIASDLHPFLHPEISIAYKTINKSLELLNGAQRARLVFPHSPNTSSPFLGYLGVLISPIHLQCQSYSRPCLKTLEVS